jgi:hypothetical protein
VSGPLTLKRVVLTGLQGTSQELPSGELGSHRSNWHRSCLRRPIWCYSGNHNYRMCLYNPQSDPRLFAVACWGPGQDACEHQDTICNTVQKQQRDILMNENARPQLHHLPFSLSTLLITLLAESLLTCTNLGGRSFPFPLALLLASFRSSFHSPNVSSKHSTRQNPSEPPKVIVASKEPLQNGEELLPWTISSRVVVDNQLVMFGVFVLGAYLPDRICLFPSNCLRVPP